MAKITYTHSFDLFYRIVLIAASVLLTIRIYTWCDGIFDPISIRGIAAGIPQWVFGLLQFVGAFTCFIISAIIVRLIVTPTISTYLYLRLSLLVPVTLREAKTVSFLFDGENDGKWYPLKELRKSPKEERKRLLFDFARRIQPSFK